MKIIEGGVTAAKGFQAAAAAAEIKYKGRTDMAMVYSEVPCVAAGTFTTNVVKAAPVKWDQDIVYNHPSAQVVICNSGIANACTGAEGYGYCKETAEAAEREAADAQSKATEAYLEAKQAQEKNTEQDKTLSEQGQKISENSMAIEQNTADIETNKQGIATNKENIEKNTQAITTERTERIQEVQRLDGRIDGLSNRIDELDGRIDKVGALAVAMAGLHPLEYDPDAPTQFSMAAGTYSGESAIAAGLFHNPNKDVLLSVGFSISGSEKAANVGATFRFGRSSESKARKVIEDKQREQELAAQAAAARQKTVSYRVEQILAEDTAKAE